MELERQLEALANMVLHDFQRQLEALADMVLAGAILVEQDFLGNSC